MFHLNNRLSDAILDVNKFIINKMVNSHCSTLSSYRREVLSNLKSEHKYHFIYKTTNLISGKYYIGVHNTDDLNDGYLVGATKGRPQKQVKCPHCNTIGACGPMKRFHFGYCKQNPNG